MIITDLLERNAKLYPDDVALVEINPANQPDINPVSYTHLDVYKRQLIISSLQEYKDAIDSGNAELLASLLQAGVDAKEKADG